MPEIEVRTIPLEELRFIETDAGPRVEGRAIVFDVPSVDFGGWVERFAPGSVELEDDLLVLFDHDSATVLGRTSAGTATASVDAQGVTFSADPPPTSWFADLRVSMQRGDIHQCSFAFIPIEDDIAFDPELNTIVRTVKRAKVLELSVVSMPAYPQTSSTARARVAEVRALIASKRSTDFAETLAEEDAQRMSSWSRLWNLEYALEETVCDIAKAGGTDADQACDDFAAAAKAWARGFLDVFGPYYVESVDSEMRADVRVSELRNNSTDDGSPVVEEAGAPDSGISGLLFIPGIGLRQFVEKNGG